MSLSAAQLEILDFTIDAVKTRKREARALWWEAVRISGEPITPYLPYQIANEVDKELRKCNRQLVSCAAALIDELNNTVS
jgi:hypothetical protein